MRLHTPSLSYYTSSLLPVPHGMFRRNGGTSTAPFASLNFSDNIGDQQERVQANRTLALEALRLSALVSVRQVHADRVLVVQPADLTSEADGYDAIISTLPGVGLLIQQADCQAILLSAPRQGVVAAVHCGWRGSVNGIIATTILRLKTDFGVDPAELRTAISPSLGPCCAEFINYRQELPAWMHAFQPRPGYFDFWAISRQQLIAAGVPAQKIDIAAVCTRCDPHFFSYRRACHHGNGTTGRNGSIIGLPR
ncbi:peptidoglycan editing factor PgeF [Desulfobulbus alkaliphilus]|uniref:peptidoglycan editing factor PgeF n=1 Tax=Desulfobulbus alkaliphilus TaxID=869814 RepID=UPI0019636B2D|nr:peptidoglycan editing factor PgeF [Desulfobulbus alkaliphilus]MBM9536813.1 peptidoglycan editing factor PgeF [Desulfobulbus alkaliphilus]